LILLTALAQNPQTDGYRRQTSLQLTLRDADGRVIAPTRADIYLDIWGGGQLVSLPREGQSAVVRLDQEWLCGASSEFCKNRMYGPSRLILKADGYAPVTAIVNWPSQQLPARVEFSGGRAVGIVEGTAGKYDITIRRPVTQIIRIVEENGTPAVGISVDAHVFFAATNHVGAVEGESLIEGHTNANGEMPIPDVDGDIAIELQRGRYVLQDPDDIDPYRKILVFGNTTSVAKMLLHRFEKQPLNLNFVSRTGNASGLILGTCLKFCSGACCGDEATTDAMGHVHIENFYPEEIDSLYLTDKSGTVLWKGDTPRNGVSITIR
jgi:hypothetical protein